MCDQHAFAKALLANCRDDFRGNSSQLTIAFAVGSTQYQRHQRGLQLPNLHSKSKREIVTERRRSHLRYGKAARRHHQGRRVEFIGAGANDELVHTPHLANSNVQEYCDAGSSALLFEHVRNFVCRTITEKLPQRFLVIGDFMLLHQRSKIRRGITCQRRFRKMRIPGKEILRPAVNICEIAAPTARNQYLFPGTLGALQHCHPPPPFSRLHRAHQSRGAGAQNHHVEFMDHVAIVSGSWQPPSPPSFESGTFSCDGATSAAPRRLKWTYAAEDILDQLHGTWT